MFYRNSVQGAPSYSRYVRGANGQEYWTPRSSYTSSAPKTEMVARNDWPCKFEGCADRTVVANVTVIVKRDGHWGHKVCPTPAAVAVDPVLAQMNADDRAMAELEMAADRAETVRAARAEIARDAADEADALLAEYETIQQARRAANVKNLQVGIYRVEFSGRRNTQAFNLKITKDRKNEGAFYFKQKESWEGAGRVFADGRIQLWTSTNLTTEEQAAAQEALEILLAAARMGKYGEAYARESGECFRCGRTLTDEDSIDRGLGSHCAKQVEAGY